jgi:hypothetical protein
MTGRRGQFCPALSKSKPVARRIRCEVDNVWNQPVGCGEVRTASVNHQPVGCGEVRTASKPETNIKPVGCGDEHMEKVRPGTGREAGLGHVRGRQRLEPVVEARTASK